MDFIIIIGIKTYKYKINKAIVIHHLFAIIEYLQ